MAQTVTFLYEGRLKDTGEVFDDGTAEPLTITLGRGKAMGPVEEALATMSVGEERLVEVSAEDGFGTYDPRALQKMYTKDVPNGDDLPVGEYILWRNPVSPKPLPVKVVSVLNGIAQFDFNHPLADRDLVYRLTLVSRDEGERPAVEG